MIPKHIPYTGFVQRQVAVSTDRADYALLLLADKAGDVGRVEKQRCELYELPRNGGPRKLIQSWRAIKSQEYLQAQPDCPRDASGKFFPSDGKYTEVMMTATKDVITTWITMKLGETQTITCAARVSIAPAAGVLGNGMRVSESHPALIGEL